MTTTVGWQVVDPRIGQRGDGVALLQELPPEREEWAALRKLGATILVATCGDEKDLVQATTDADAILLGGVELRRAVLQHMRQCRVIVRRGVGYDNVDVDAATEMGIIVVNTPDFCVEEVANHAIMLLLACAKRLTAFHVAMRSGQWLRRAGPLPLPSIYGQTLGLVGFGRLARAVARKAKGFHLRVIAYDPYADKAAAWESGVELLRTDLNRLLQQADYVSIHVPLNAETCHLFGEAEFRAMKPTAYLINTARGAVVDEPALIRALQEGWIAGAGLDVFEQEPVDPHNPLLTMDNVVLTPHVGSDSAASTREQRVRAGEEAARVLSGVWPLCPVNPQVRPRVALRQGPRSEPGA